MKAASNIFALQHNIQQWIFLSKTKSISTNDHYGLDGWLLNIMTEKNKIAPSKNYISCVFDKYRGIDKFWSEFLFLSEMTYSEKKILKTPNKLPFPLLITSHSDKKIKLKVVDTQGKVLYESEPMYKKKSKEMYETNEEFRTWFDYAMDLSCYERITNGMFKISESQLIAEMETPQIDEIDLQLESDLNPPLVEDEELVPPDPPEIEEQEIPEDLPKNDEPESKEDLDIGQEETDIQNRIYQETMKQYKEKEKEVSITDTDNYTSVF